MRCKRHLTSCDAGLAFFRPAGVCAASSAGAAVLAAGVPELGWDAERRGVDLTASPPWSSPSSLSSESRPMRR